MEDVIMPKAFLSGCLPVFVFFCTDVALASTVFRCEDPGGKVSFTFHGCPTDQQQSLQRAHNPAPGLGQPVLMAPVAEKQPHASKRPDPEEKDEVELAVFGVKQDGCGNRVTGPERRTAIIRQEIRSGMTRQDVESALGRPDRVTGQNGQTRYYYSDDKGQSRQVAFDEAGCVRAKP
jgi:hypothetical protein